MRTKHACWGRRSRSTVVMGRMLAGFLAFAAVAAVDLALAIPQTINYQGLLVDNGTPVNGSKSVRFRVYDSAQGGAWLWQETQTVAFAGGMFNVLLGSTDTIPKAVFSGARRWLSVSIDDGPEILPRGEIVSVGYAFRSSTADLVAYADSAKSAGKASNADMAANANLLDGYDSSQFSGTAHTHDTRYFTQTQLKTSDGSPPNQGSNLVHWNILTGVPETFADGVDDTGAGATDHGALTGLFDNDHPQYALQDSLKTSDGTPPNQGSGLVHWNILTGVPAGFADGADNITQDASLITTGAMSPERIEGVAVVDSDPRLLTVTQKSGLTGGGTTALHSHSETGDISSVTAGAGLSGGGTTGAVTLSHAGDASALPFAHHYPPIVAGAGSDHFESNATSPVPVISLTIDCPTDGYLQVTFSGTQELDVDFDYQSLEYEAKCYIARYGVAVDTANSYTYSVASSMQDREFFGGDLFRPSKPVMGTTVVPVAQGRHTVYFLTHMYLVIDAGADNNIDRPSLAAVFFPYDSSDVGGELLGSADAASTRMNSDPRTSSHDR